MNLKNCVYSLLALSLAAAMAFAVQEKVGAIKGTVTKIDRGAKTAVVKMADGTEHVMHFVDRTTVHGVEKTSAGAEDAFHGLREGSSVVVHYTAKGAEETAEEVDHIGKDGLHMTRGHRFAHRSRRQGDHDSDRKWRQGNLQISRPRRRGRRQRRWGRGGEVREGDRLLHRGFRP